MNPFKKPAPALELNLAEADAALAAAREAFTEAALAAQDDPTPAAIAARETARKNIERAKQAHDDLVAASVAGAKRKARQDAEEKRAEIERRWQEAEALAKEHAALAKKVEKLAKEFADTLAEIHRVGEDLHHVAPQRSSYLSSSMLAHDTVDGFVRLELRRHGVQWVAKHWGSDIGSIPVFSERMAEARQDILRLRAA